MFNICLTDNDIDMTYEAGLYRLELDFKWLPGKSEKELKPSRIYDKVALVSRQLKSSVTTHRNAFHPYLQRCLALSHKTLRGHNTH